MRQTTIQRQREKAAAEAMNTRAREMSVARARVTVPEHNRQCVTCHQFSGVIYRPGVCPGMSASGGGSDGDSGGGSDGGGASKRLACWMDPKTRTRPALADYEAVLVTLGLADPNPRMLAETRGVA